MTGPSWSASQLTSLSSDDFSKLLGSMSLTPEEWGQLQAIALKGLASTDVFAYGEYAYKLRPAAHHREMVEWMMDRVSKGEDGVILEPRGHAKTTWANTIFLSWLIAKNPNIRIGLISNTATQANAFSRAIRFNFETNQYHREIFGDLVGPNKWTDVEWIQRGSPLHATKDLTMYSQGAGGAILSKRFDLIICDDILDKDNTANAEQIEKVKTWFWQTLKPCLAPFGSLIVIGTRWAEGDLYQELLDPPEKEGKGWPSLVRGAIRYPDGDDNHEHPEALWPDLWPLPRLERERNDMGSSMFACAYLNDISGMMTGNIFQKRWFQYYGGPQDPILPGKNLRWKMGIDLASSVKERADYTARAIIAIDDRNNVYVERVDRRKMEDGHAQFVEEGAAMASHPIERIVVENNQFQSALVQELLRRSQLPVVGRKTDVDKVTRARALAARYESGKVFHHRSLMGSDFEIELLSFDKGHDDMVDALGHAVEVGKGGMFFGSFKRPE